MKDIFLTYFPAYKDLHFYKDPGQIPFRFKKELGYESYIITIRKKRDCFVETNKHLRTLLLRKNYLFRYISFIYFLIRNRKHIKIFNIFHIGFHNIFVAWLCKLVVPSVFIYLKMDNCIYSGPYLWETLFDKTLKTFTYNNVSYGLKTKYKNYFLKRFFINIINLFSVEDEDSREYYEKKYKFFKNKIITIYNGHTVDLFSDIYQKVDKNKKNIILTVGRLGAYEKATDILLKAFSLIAVYNDWELHLAGSIDEKFLPFLNKYFNDYPELKARIIFYGSLRKSELFDLYQQSKIFCLPSRYEGFANVFSEAMFFKNAIITTKYVSPKNLIANRFGLVVDKDNVKELSEAILYLINNPRVLKEFSHNGHVFAKYFLNWDYITNILYHHMIRHGFKK